jgi:hypothetical protein
MIYKKTMIELILTKLILHLDKFIAVSMLIILGFLIRLTLQIFGQTWIQTKAHTSTILMLPIITYVITNVISGNIALSLGMVGALSIVRFRNPVRSPLELSVYFCSITMGISASVSLLWLVFLTLAITMAIISLVIANKLSQNLFAKPFFNTSFSEGNTLSSITIKSKERIDHLENHSLLQSKVFSNHDNTYLYHLTSPAFNLLKEIGENIESKLQGCSIELRR